MHAGVFDFERRLIPDPSLFFELIRQFLQATGKRSNVRGQFFYEHLIPVCPEYRVRKSGTVRNDIDPFFFADPALALQLYFELFTGTDTGQQIGNMNGG